MIKLDKVLQFKILKGAQIDEEHFNEFYGYLEKCFLREEYRSFEAQKALIKKKIYEILFCILEGKTVGVIAFWHLDDFIFIEHLAVDESMRGQKIGTKMLEFIKKHFNTRVILEVELPYNEINRKRIAFYEHSGFIYNDFEYYQKPLNKGDEPLPLRIMSYPDSLSAEKFSIIRKKLIEGVYNS